MEERRAEQQFVEAEQDLLDDETRRRLRRFGARGSFMGFSGRSGSSGGRRGGPGLGGVTHSSWGMSTGDPGTGSTGVNTGGNQAV